MLLLILSAGIWTAFRLTGTNSFEVLPKTDGPLATTSMSHQCQHLTTLWEVGRSPDFSESLLQICAIALHKFTIPRLFSSSRAGILLVCDNMKTKVRLNVLQTREDSQAIGFSESQNSLFWLSGLCEMNEFQFSWNSFNCALQPIQLYTSKKMKLADLSWKA